MDKELLTIFLTRYRKAKRERNAAALEYWRDTMRGLRQQWHKSIDNNTYIPDEYGEGYTVIYSDLFEFDGTKSELLTYLWENHATRIYSEYDCTGKYFTANIRAAHHSDNLWRICEVVGLDV